MGQDCGIFGNYEERRRVRRIIGRNVTCLRTSQELPKCLLCLMACISRPTLDKVEAGGNTTINTLAKVAAALGVGLADLLDEDASENNPAA